MFSERLEKRVSLTVSSMDNFLGLLRIRIRRGVNLARRDFRSSDPYVIIKFGKQKLKTHVVNNTLNPEWNEDLTLCITEKNKAHRIILKVYDKDTFSRDDYMGEAEFEILPLLHAVPIMRSFSGSIPSGTIIMSVIPNRLNFLAEESCIRWVDSQVVQDMVLRLRNVECGEVELQLKWIDA